MSGDPWHFSGSGAERALACPASTFLPQVGRLTNAAAESGTAQHAFLQMCSEFGRDKALALVATREKYLPYLEICEAIQVDKLPTELAHEVAFAFNMRTGEARELGRNIGRDYAKYKVGKSEIPLSIDVVGVNPDAVYVGDYKTGRLEVTEPSRNIQLGLAALCAARCYGRDAAVVEIIKPGRDGGAPFSETAELDVFDLDELAARFKAWPGRHKSDCLKSATDPAPVTIGSHCRFCPSYSFCPAKTSLAIRVGTGEELREMHTELTRETAARVYLRAKAAKEFLNKIFEAIYGMAQQEPIEFSPGQFLGKHTKTGNEKLEGAIVHDVMSELYTPQVANAACEFTSSKAGIKRALRALRPLGIKVAPAEREILDAVKQRGGITRKPTTKVREYSAE